MFQSSGLVVFSGLFTLAVAFVGMTWGRYIHTLTGPSLAQLAYIVAGLLGIGSLFQGAFSVGHSRFGQLAATGLVAFVVLGAVIEPLAFVKDSAGIISVAWLSPVILGGVLLPPRGCWLVALGCWAVVFSGAVALGYNVSQGGSGTGFLLRWMQ